MEQGSLKILVVDDFEMIRTMLTNTLNNLGYSEIQQAQDGREALDALIAASSVGKPFGLVFADWNMPEMNGLELLQECRADDRFKKVPIIMVTAEADRSMVMTALMSGASDYMIKPFSPDAIEKKIANISKNLKKAS